MCCSLDGCVSAFYVYLSGELYFWQAVGFVVFYLFFVGFVFWMDFGSGSKKVVDFEAQSGVELLGFDEKDDQVHQTISGILSAFNKLYSIRTDSQLAACISWGYGVSLGNSVGDLVADMAVAKAGQPALAMAECFAGPMFNMLTELGTAYMIETVKVYPEPYVLHFHVSIIIAFVFHFLSLMGSLLVVTWSRFRVPRFWSFCLVGLYVVFIVVSLIIAKFSA